MWRCSEKTIPWVVCGCPHIWSHAAMLNSMLEFPAMYFRNENIWINTWNTTNWAFLWSWNDQYIEANCYLNLGSNGVQLLCEDTSGTFSKIYCCIFGNLAQQVLFIWVSHCSIQILYVHVFSSKWRRKRVESCCQGALARQQQSRVLRHGCSCLTWLRGPPVNALWCITMSIKKTYPNHGLLDKYIYIYIHMYIYI